MVDIVKVRWTINDFFKWINNSTSNSKIVIEFGSMFFDKLKYVNNNAKKIGIEIHKPYIDMARYHDCIKIHGDILKFEELVDEDDYDTCMIIDVLEHFDKDVALNLSDKIKKKFKKWILMIPEGYHPQHIDVFNTGADEYQTHKSYWSIDDIIKLGFNEIYFDDKFHSHNIGTDKSSGCIFAIWNKT